MEETIDTVETADYEKDWDDLMKEYKILENLNKEYISKLEEVGELQGKCMKEIAHQRYRLGVIKNSMKKYESF